MVRFAQKRKQCRVSMKGLGVVGRAAMTLA
jgi:hypothetical protein